MPLIRLWNPHPWFIILLGGLFVVGCKQYHQPVAESAPKLSARKLLEQPLSSLFPPPAPLQGASQFNLSPIHVMQVGILRSNGKKVHFRLYRQPKNTWWVINNRGVDSDWGLTMTARPVKSILAALRNLKPAPDDFDMPSSQARIQISLNTKGEQFLLRILQAPTEEQSQGVYQGQWLVYYNGALYQQPAKGPLSEAVPQLRQRLLRLRRRGGWLQMPTNSNSFSIPMARQLAQQFAKKRKNLRRCFKKRRFPSSIGPFRVNLFYSNQGKYLKRKILTRKHVKHRVVWCPLWHVSKWKFLPAPGKNVSFQLVLPPGGP